MRTHTARLAAMGVIAAASNLTAAGETPTWVGGVGDWNNPANWSTGAVPPAGSGFFITNGGAATATDLDLDLGDAIVGGLPGPDTGDGALTIRGGTSSIGQAFGVFIGQLDGTTGALTLTDGAQVQSNARLVLGRWGAAAGEIDGGAVLDAGKFFVGGQDRTDTRRFTADATLDIAGPGTAVRATAPNGFPAFTIGLEGRADVTVRDGALVDTTDLLLVTTTPADSTLTIEGPDTVVRVASDQGPAFGFAFGRDIALDPGIETGDAIITLRAGATIDARDTLGRVSITEQGVLRGAGRVLGDAVNRLGLIDPGEGGSFGHLTISGTLDNSGDIDHSPDFGGTLRFDIGGVALGQHDRITVGSLLRGGTLEVALAPGYDASLGDTFGLVTITEGITFPEPNAFDEVILPELGGPLFFETTIDASGVTLAVVPAPPSLAALGVLGLGLTRRRR